MKILITSLCVKENFGFEMNFSSSHCLLDPFTHLSTARRRESHLEFGCRGWGGEVQIYWRRAHGSMARGERVHLGVGLQNTGCPSIEPFGARV